MKQVSRVRLGFVALLGALALAVVAARAFAAQATPPPSGQKQVNAIDTDCAAIQNAVMALKPVHFIYSSSTWKVASDQDVTVAERTKASVTIADVWKQGKSYAWVHSHSYDQKGNQSATQLCFRQADGTLERAKQAADIASLAGADAAIGYFTSAGDVIYKSELFELNDPKLAKKISDLPFYKDLP